MTKADLIAALAEFDDSTVILIADMGPPFMLMPEHIGTTDAYWNENDERIHAQAIYIGVDAN